MVKAYLHGSSMLYYTPVEKKQIRWNTKDAWCSALELASKEWEVAEEEEKKCLMVDLSYTISAPVAYYEGKYYSYFGCTPVLTFNFPYYWINDELPTIGMTVSFFGILAIWFMCKTEKFKKFIFVLRIQDQKLSTGYYYAKFLILDYRSFGALNVYNSFENSN